jgi:hypothetical protein
MRKGLVTLVAALCMAVAATVSPATAATQNGLVNLNLDDVTVQVPVAVAANVCDVNVAAILAGIRDTGSTDCEATALPLSEATITSPDSGGNTRQNGLINVNIEDTIIQIPIAAAANVCDVNVAILLAAILDTGATGCTADAGPEGIVFPTP